MTAPQLTLHKYHGLGNDFLIAVDPAGELALGAAEARRLCDRRRGVGADGLVHSVPGLPSTFRLWNADGSEAEMSGNGLRCLAHALADEGWAPAWTSPGGAPGAGTAVEMEFTTPAGRRTVRLRPGAQTGQAWGSVEMGPVLVATTPGACNVGDGRAEVDAGNPHLVVFGPHPDTVDVAKLGPALAGGVAGGRNVEFVALGPGPDEITMRVWERGVGETAACGTGSCAAAAAVHRWGRVGSRVTVHQPGGAVEVALAPDGTATLSGPSQRVTTCLVPWPAPVGAS
jgi:diaminopimelate epimerase